MSTNSILRKRSNSVPSDRTPVGTTQQTAAPKKSLSPQQPEAPKKASGSRPRARSVDEFSKVPRQQAKQKAAQASTPLVDSAKFEKAARKPLSAKGQSKLRRLKSGLDKTGSDAVQPQSHSKLTARPMQGKFAAEALAPDRKVTTTDGKTLTVRDKGWAQNQSTHYMSPQEKQAHETLFFPVQDQRSRLVSRQGVRDMAAASAPPPATSSTPAPTVQQGAISGSTPAAAPAIQQASISSPPLEPKPAASPAPIASADSAPVPKKSRALFEDPVAPDPTPTLKQIEGDKKLLVMDKSGKVYSSAQKTWSEDGSPNKVHSHHSSFTQGQPLPYSGEAVTRPDDTLRGLTDRSGHYQPSAKETVQGMNALQKGHGLNLDNLQFDLVRANPGRTGAADKITHGMAREYLQGQGSESLFKARHQIADEIEAAGKPKVSLEGDRPVVKTSLQGSLKDTDETKDRSAPVLKAETDRPLKPSEQRRRAAEIEARVNPQGTLQPKGKEPAAPRKREDDAIYQQPSPKPRAQQPKDPYAPYP